MFYSLLSLGLRVARMAGANEWVEEQSHKWLHEREFELHEGERLFRLGSFTQAEAMLETALTKHKLTSLGYRLDLTLLLAEAQRRLKKLDKAEAALTWVLEESSKKNTANERYAMALEVKSNIASDCGLYDEAFRLARESMNIEEQLKRKDAPRAIARRAQLVAAACYRAGDRSNAEPLFRRSIRLHEETFGPDHLETGIRLLELGSLYLETGQHTQALEPLRRALGILSNHQQDASVELARCHFLLGNGLRKTSEMDAAGEHYEKALMLADRNVANDSEPLIQMLGTLGELYASAGRFGLARERLERQISLLENHHDPRLPAALEALAKLFDRVGRSGEAKELRARAARA